MLDVGMVYPPSVFRSFGFYVEKGTGEMRLHTATAKWGPLGKLAGNIVAVKRILDYRTGLELAARQGTFDGAFRDYLYENSLAVLRRALQERFGEAGDEMLDRILREEESLRARRPVVWVFLGRRRGTGDQEQEDGGVVAGRIEQGERPCRRVHEPHAF
jgi:hypothetical protein